MRGVVVWDRWYDRRELISALVWAMHIVIRIDIDACTLYVLLAPSRCIVMRLVSICSNARQTRPSPHVSAPTLIWI